MTSCYTNEECSLGLCVPTRDGARVCSKLCHESGCGDPSWVCGAWQASEPEALYVCLDPLINLCEPCSAYADCTAEWLGGPFLYCVESVVQSYCTRTCGSDSDCPDGFACESSAIVDLDKAKKVCVSMSCH
jgi:hypothetical protein